MGSPLETFHPGRGPGQLCLVGYFAGKMTSSSDGGDGDDDVDDDDAMSDENRYDGSLSVAATSPFG